MAITIIAMHDSPGLIATEKDKALVIAMTVTENLNHVQRGDSR
jgi:hypothetical protein